MNPFKLNILLIEDDETDRLIFEKKLKSVTQNYELVTADSLESAKKLQNLINIDAVFCDYNLPDGTALDFLESFAFMDDASVIILTSLTDLSIAIDSLKKGAVDFLKKEEINAENLNRILAVVVRRKAENKLRRDLEKRLDDNYANTRAILNNTTDGIWSLDKDGKLLIINQLAKTNIKEHYNSSPKIGELFFKSIPQLFIDVWKPMFNRALNKEQSVSIDEFSLDSGTFYLESSCSPIVNKGTVQGVTFFVREVTEREKSEQKIRENERNFRSIFEGSDVPILVESQKDGRIIDLNEACAHMHGHTVDKMIGMHFHETIPDWHLEQAKKGFDLYQKGKLDILDSFILTVKKEAVPVQISVAPITFNDQPARLIFYQDISVRKETEKKLQEAKELAEKSAEFKSLFLANMSHEIRTPLNALVGFADLLESTPINKEQKDYINIIQKSGEDLLVIINDILDLSKIEAGKMKIRPRKFSLINELNQIIKLHQHKANSKGLKLTLEVDSNVPQNVFADNTRISQILNNLINNAIKFTDKGEINVSVKQVKDLTQFNVQDSGIGLNKTDLISIFENFSQVDAGIQRKHHGTGLGLSIVKQLVELMGGQVSVSSEINKGSNFGFLIPLKEVDECEVEIAQNAHLSTDLSDLKILVCEDNPVNVKLIERVLSKLKLNVTFALNGKEGIEKARSEKPDVIFMDLQMPIIDGYEATLKIKEFSTVPIFALSAHVLEEERAKCIEAGMSGFIPKPFKEKDIVEVLNMIGIEKEKGPAADQWDKLNMPTLTNLADGDVEFANSLFDIYISSTNEEIIKYEDALKNNDSEKLAQIAHKVKPSLLTFEFEKARLMAEKIEALSQDQLVLNSFKNELVNSIEIIRAKQKVFNQ